MAVMMLSACCLLIGAAPPPSTTPSENVAGATGIGNKAEAAAAATPARIDRLNAPCMGATVDRGSSLCAQWVAADAARESARYALWAILVGAGTLIAAIAAAAYAAVAARAARDTLGHERSLILPRFEVSAELRVFSGSGNVLRLTLAVVGDNPARAIAIDHLTLEKGALGPGESLERLSSVISEDAQTLMIEFRPPAAIADYPARDEVKALIGEEVSLVTAWSCRDASGACRTNKVALRGRFASRSEPDDRTLQIAAAMSTTTFDRSI